MNSEDVFTHVNREYYQLTGAEKKIADYVMLHQQECQFMSISQLSEEAEVAEATVSRFCRRLGYSGYNAFKLALAGSAGGRTMTNPLSGEVIPEDSVSDMCRKLYTNHVDALTQTLELVRPEAVLEAAELLLRSDKVLCMGQGGSMILAQEAAHLFSTAKPNFFAIEDSHVQAVRAATLSERDAVLYFSYSGATKDLVDAMRIVKSRGAGAILITRFAHSPGAGYADVVLECGSRESPLQAGSVAARMAQLYLLDVLFSEVCRRDIETTRARRKQVAEALADKHI